MNTTLLKPYAERLLKLGVRRPRSTLRDPFGSTAPPKPRRDPTIKPDVDYHPDAEREPQAQNYTAMWLDHWNHWGDVKNPVGSPMQSGA